MTETPEVRPRRAGKTAEKFAKMTGLKPETCMDLLAAGWSLVREKGEPTRWVQGAHRRDDALARGGVLPRGTVTMVSDGGGCVAPGGPGFGPGPAAGAGAVSIGPGAIVIQQINDPVATAHGVADAIRRVREHQAEMRQGGRS